MPALQTGSAGVDVQQVQRLVELDFEDVRVSCYEQLGRIGIQLPANGVVIVAWVAANVLHQHLDVLTLPAQHLGVHQAQVAPVAVAADGTQRPELCQALSDLGRTDVSSMPYLVAGLEVVQVLVVPVAVGVADDSYSLHGADGSNGSDGLDGGL